MEFNLEILGKIMKKYDLILSLTTWTKRINTTGFKYVLMSKLHKVSGVILNIDMHWLSENENDEKKLLNIINLAKYFIEISKKIKINYKVWYHIEDLIKRYNNNFPDKKIDIDFIYKEPEIEPEKYDNLFLNYCKFINKFWI